eukprot:gnl/TRDRNA2_/TRDRNA2_177464_c5_seq5.p1 gnl/TRDRNA2_/TRDRNA2_177464_c5~~gnl/TRDRNA2_/TRDRNA2_177464_c5_seq5.p1  ORF type:complete len:185 (-),score=9.88 gnl/TRDRNA2_/TRDRNA2_177464_c5_seq5:550-1104(-)
MSKKRKHDPVATGVPWISTNDILTSTFFTTIRAGYARTVFNLRGRIPELSSVPDTVAGNAFTCMLYWPDECDTAAKIRKSIMVAPNFKDYGRQDVPSLWKDFSMGMHSATSWASFYKDLDVPECKLIAHVPATDMSFSSGSTIIPFYVRTNQLAVMYLVHDKEGMEAFSNHPCLGQPVIFGEAL